MHVESNHLMDFGPHKGAAEIDFSVMEFEINEHLVDEPLLIYFRSVNRTHDYDFEEEPQLCAEVYMEIEFRTLQSLHKCDSSYPELTTKKKPILIGAN